VTDVERVERSTEQSDPFRPFATFYHNTPNVRWRTQPRMSEKR
jgi:hypothetical protein